MNLTLVFNCGSSSLKMALVQPSDGTTVLSALAEKLFEAQPSLTVSSDGGKTSLALEGQGHATAMQALMALLVGRRLLERVSSVGHRVVHGGEAFREAVQITPEVLERIEACVPLAPLHNPANLIGIRAAMAALPNLPHVAVFDTAFHQTIPATAFRYAVPESLYLEHGVRRYGFHGTSHQYVTRKAAQMLGLPLEQTRFVSAHLGNGCSITAVRGGQSVDTSMGFTPLEGLVMGTRSGDVDPGLHAYLAGKLGLTLDGVTDLLNKQSGLLGLSNLSNDCRTLEAAMRDGHAGAKLALEVFCYRLAKYVAAMGVPLGRLDALIFTGGIGENSSFVRATTLAHLEILGFKLDEALNQSTTRGASGPITQPGTLALVVPTNEEWMIATQTQEVLA